MRYLLLGVGVSLMLSGCMRATLISENRDGYVVFLRTIYDARPLSDKSADEYCQRYQKPATWVATKMTKEKDGYQDTYKCGALPPVKMSTEREERNQSARPVSRRDYRKDQPVSGDYFGSRRTGQPNSNDW